MLCVKVGDSAQTSLATMWLVRWALLHAVVDQRKIHKGWLAAFYVVTLFVMPHLMAVVAVMGLVDTWADFRQRFAKN